MKENSDSIKWVLITGASTGIGAVFAKRLARENYALILVARSGDKLKHLSCELESAYRVQVISIPTDLAALDAGRLIEAELTNRKIQLYGLVNNAGCGASGEFTNVSLERYLNMIDLNVRVLVELTHRFLPGMIQRNRGFIINVSSTASFQPIPYSSVYAATKSFVTSFTESLWLETKHTRVRILNLCPGLTKTPFGIVAGTRDFRNDPIAEEPEQVVEVALRALSKNYPTIISGWYNRLLVLIERLLPHRLLLWGTLVVQNMRGRKL